MIILVIKIILAIFLVSAAYAGLKAAPWLPAKKNDVTRVTGLTNLRPGQSFIDIGAGDGRVVAAIAKAFGPNVSVVGLEISVFPYILALIRLKLISGLSRVKFRFRDLYKQDLSGFDVVYCYLMPKTLARLHDKFMRELKPGAVVISYVFGIEGWVPKKIDRPNENQLPIYVYVKD